MVALFEEASYFEYERERYAQLAASARVVVGFAGDPAPLPAGVEHLALPDSHELAGEWSVLVLSPLGSAGLVARDLDRVVAEESLERGRVFSPEMSTGTAWVSSQVERIVTSAGGLLDPELGAELLARGRRASEHGDALPERILRDELLAGW